MTQTEQVTTNKCVPMPTEIEQDLIELGCEAKNIPFPLKVQIYRHPKIDNDIALITQMPSGVQGIFMHVNRGEMLDILQRQNNNDPRARLAESLQAIKDTAKKLHTPILDTITEELSKQVQEMNDLVDEKLKGKNKTLAKIMIKCTQLVASSQLSTLTYNTMVK